MPGSDDNVKATKEAASPQHNTRTRRRPGNGRILGINTASLTAKVKNLQLGEKIPGVIDKIKESSLFRGKNEIPQEEQDHLKNEFLVYVSTRQDLITDPEQLQDFNKQVEKFLRRMAGRENDHWGSDRYFRLLEKWFPDYAEVISGKVKSIKDSIGLQINSLNEQIVEITAKTKEAMQLAGTDVQRAQALLQQTKAKLDEAREKSTTAAATLTEFGSEEQQQLFASSYSQIITNYSALISSVESSIAGMNMDMTKYQNLIPQLDDQANKLQSFNSKVQQEQDVQTLLKIQQTEFRTINEGIRNFIEGINLNRGTAAINEEKVDQEVQKESQSLTELDTLVADTKAKEIARREEEKRRKAEEERKRQEAEAERLRKEQEAAKLKPSNKKDEDVEITAENSASSNIALLISTWKTHGDGDKRKLAYILATVEGECGFRSKAEKKQVSARTDEQKDLIRKQNEYWPSGYYGRGMVQITWLENYEKAKKLTGVDVVTYPDKVLTPKVAATIAVRGMINGMFTTRKLSHYFNDNKTDWENARAIINGSDRASDFAKKAKAHYNRLKSEDGGETYYKNYLNFADKQTVLKAEGLYTGTIDGMSGPNSNKAIKAFKTKYDLKDDNAFDKKIRELLHGKKEKVASKEEKEKTPSAKERVEALYAQYKKDEIDMVQLGKALIPYAFNDGATHVQAILEDLGRTNDNLAYAMVSNTDDSVLRLFNKDLLDDLADALAPENNYVNVVKKRILYDRINSIVGSAKKTLINSENKVAKSDAPSDAPKVKEKIREATVSQKINQTVGITDEKFTAVNNKSDVIKVAKQLKKLNIEVPEDSLKGLVNDKFYEAIINFQKSKGLTQDAKISVNGNTASKLFGTFTSSLPKLFGSRGKFIPYLNTETLSGSVGISNGRNGDNFPKDITLVRTKLLEDGITTREGDLNDLVKGIKEYQKKHNINPNSGYIPRSGKTALHMKITGNSGDSIGRIERTMSDSSYNYSKGTDEPAYYEKVGNIKKNLNIGEGRTEDLILNAARNCASNDEYFAAFTKGISEKLDWSYKDPKTGESVTKSADGNELSTLLESRISKLHKFFVAAGLYKGDMLVTSAVRSKITAHKWSTEHFILSTEHQNHHEQIKENLIMMYNNTTYRDGKDVKDEDGNVWAKQSHFIFAEDDIAKKKAIGVDFNLVKQFVDRLNYRNNKKAIAAEGYVNGSKRLPLPTSGRPGRSLHITGNAIDVNSLQFINRDDGIIDLVALNFGLVRSAPKEQWHFECTDLRVSKSEQEIIDEEKR